MPLLGEAPTQTPSPRAPETSDPSTGELGPESDLEPMLASVVLASGREVTLTASPLSPSRPGFAGDRGTLAGVEVLDIEEHDGSLVHLLERPTALVPSQPVLVCLDRDRRDRLARTHASVVLLRAELQRRSVRLTSVELAAGLAWLEIDERDLELDFSALLERELDLTPVAIGGGLMRVRCGQTDVTTTLAPIARSSSQLADVEVRAVAALEGGRSALEIALPDAKGRWWR